MANRINVSLSLDTTEFQRAIKGVERTVQRFGDSLSRIGGTLTSSLTIPLGLAGAAAVNSFAQIDKLRKGMIAMTGSAEAADAELAKLREVAKLPGLGFQEAIKGSINLQAVGLSADEARQTLLGFGKALAVTGGGKNELDRIQVQLTQMISKNKLLAEDYKVIQSLLPLMGDAMERTFGTRNIDAIRETGLSAKDFALRLAGTLNTMPQVQNVTGGLANAFENFGDTLNIVGSQIGQAIAESLNLEGVLSKLSTALQSVADWFTDLPKPMQKFITIAAAVAVAIGPILFIVGKMSGVLAAALSGVRALAGGLAFLASPIGLIVAAIAAVVAGLVYAYKNFEGFRKLVNAVGAAVAVAARAIGAAFGELWDRAKVFISGTVAALTKLGAVLFDKIKPWLPLMGKILGGMLKITATIVGGIISHFVGMTNSIISLLSEIGAVVKEVVGGFVKTFQALAAGEFKQAFQAIADTPTVFQAFKRVGVAAADGYTAGFQGVQDTFKDMQKAFQAELEATNKTFHRIGRSGAPDAPGFTASPDEAPTGSGKVGENLARNLMPVLEPLGKINQGLRDVLVNAKAVDAIKGVALREDFQQSAEQSKYWAAQIAENAEKARQALAEKMAAARVHLDNFNAGLTQIVNEGLQNLIIGFAEGIGQLAESGGGIQAVFGNILGVIVGVMEQLGKLAIAAGVATLGIKTALQTLNPAAAIIAGGALVVLSRVIRAKMKGLASFAEGGLVFGPTLALVGDNPGARNDPEVIAPFSKLEKMMGSGSGAMQLTGVFEVRGQDLVLVLDRARAQQSRIK